jgi:hypothetical protein
MAAVIEEFASAPIIASEIFDYGFGQAPERLNQRILARTNVRIRRKETWRGWLGRGF